MTTIEVTAGDSGYDINFTLQNANETAFDLSGGAIVFNAQLEGSATVSVTGSGTIVSALDGTCKYTPAVGNFATPGRYYAELQVTIGSKIVTFGDIVIISKPQLPR